MNTWKNRMVPQSDVKRRVLEMYREREESGRNRPTNRELQDGTGVGWWRVCRAIQSLTAEGVLPGLDMVLASREPKAADQREEYDAIREQIRSEKAWRNQERPGVVLVDEIGRAVREVRAAERRIGIGRAG